jgi:hypothetical protein
MSTHMKEAITLQWLQPVLSRESRSAASVREMSDTLVDMRHDVQIVTYVIGQPDIKVRRAKVHRIAPFRPETDAKIGPSAREQQEARLFIVGRAGWLALSAVPWIGSCVYE